MNFVLGDSDEEEEGLYLNIKNGTGSQNQTQESGYPGPNDTTFRMGQTVHGSQTGSGSVPVEFVSREHLPQHLRLKMCG